MPVIENPLETARRALGSTDIVAAKNDIDPKVQTLLDEARANALDLTHPAYYLDGALSGTEIAEGLIIAAHKNGVRVSMTSFSMPNNADIMTPAFGRDGRTFVQGCSDHAVAVINGSVLDPRVSDKLLDLDAYKALLTKMNPGLSSDSTATTARIEIACGRQDAPAVWEKGWRGHNNRNES